MTMINTLPAYCERLTDGIFGEPLNLLTNLLIIASALFAWRKLNKTDTSHKKFLYFMIVSIALTGFGSGAFHAMPNYLTLSLDAIPIYIFVLSALTFLLNKLSKSWNLALVLITAFMGMLILATIVVPVSFLNGSIRHVITFILLIGLVYWSVKKYGRTGLQLLLVLFLYGIAIVARSIDQLVCSALPFGTHFIWHIFNAFASYYALVFLINISVTNRNE